MSSILPEIRAKSSVEYLSAISGNSGEKIAAARQLAQNPEGNQKKILDLGCGGGESSVELATNTNAVVIAFDLFHESLKRITFQQDNYFKVAGDGVSLPFATGSLDCVNGSSVLHEIFSYSGGRRAVDQSLDEISRVTKSGGAFFFRDIYVPEGAEFNEPVTLSLNYPLFRIFYDIYTQHNRLVASLKQSALLTATTDEISMPCYAAVDLLNHYVYFRNDAYIYLMGGTAPCPPYVEIDIQLLKLLESRVNEANQLIMAEAGEQYIHISRKKLIERLKKRGFIFSSEKYVSREYYTDYLDQCDLPPLAGTKLMINFRKD